MRLAFVLFRLGRMARVKVVFESLQKLPGMVLHHRGNLYYILYILWAIRKQEEKQFSERMIRFCSYKFALHKNAILKENFRCLKNNKTWIFCLAASINAHISSCGVQLSNC